MDGWMDRHSWDMMDSFSHELEDGLTDRHSDGSIMDVRVDDRH
jgi:hypothetical protein